LLFGRTYNNTGLADVFPFSPFDQLVKHWFRFWADLSFCYLGVRGLQRIKFRIWAAGCQAF